jgi:hypothetical protein
VSGASWFPGYSRSQLGPGVLTNGYYLCLPAWNEPSLTNLSLGKGVSLSFPSICIIPEVAGSIVELKLGAAPPAMSNDVEFPMDCPLVVAIVVNV